MPRNRRGGPREATPGKAYSNRTDLNERKPLPPQAVPGQTYGKAAEVYTRMVDRFPGGRFAERGAWKAGWWAYRENNFAETIRIFERGAVQFPRSDYRPPWLYWTARAYDRMGQRAKAVSSFAARNYGYTRLSELIKAVPNFEVRPGPDGGLLVKRLR